MAFSQIGHIKWIGFSQIDNDFTLNQMSHSHLMT